MTLVEKKSSPSKPVWAIILAGCLVLCLAFGVRSSYGLFVKPITDELGWGREVLALSLAIQNLMWGVAQPFAGMIADRFGAGRVLIFSALLYTGGVALGAMEYTPVASHIGPGFFVGIGLSGTTFGVVLSVIGRSVSEDKRSLALGIATASASLGQFLIIPLGNVLLQSFGWSGALFILSFMVLVIVPAAYFLQGVPLQPKLCNKTFPRGMIKNCPREAEAVAIPRARDLLSSDTERPITERTTPNVVPLKPIPTKKPGPI